MRTIKFFSRRLRKLVLLIFAGFVCILSTTNSSQAEVIYKNVYVYMINQGSYGLDLNGDGITDYLLALDLKQYTCGYSIKAVEVPGQGNGAEGTPPKPLTAGTPIGPNLAFYSGSQTIGYLTDNCGSWASGGSFLHAGQISYLGLKFLINGKIHYGWVQVQVYIVVFGPPKLVERVTGFAYETDACQSMQVKRSDWFTGFYRAHNVSLTVAEICTAAMTAANA